MEIMNQYRDFNYIYNPKWNVTGNAYSLSMALTLEPCIVVSGDLFLSDRLCDEVRMHQNAAVVKSTENRNPSSLKAVAKNGILERCIEDVV